MKIISLEAENFKRLKAVYIEPGGSTVIVGGKNGAGKSSALDAIKAAIGGKKNCPEEPVRRGAKKAEIILKTDDFTVIRTFSKSGTALQVTATDGKRFGSPQTMLDELVGSLSFDPLEFSRMKPPDQAEVVRRLAGLDFSKADQQRSDLYDERTDVGRDLKKAKAILDEMVEPLDAPKEEVSISGQLRELERRRQINTDNEEQREELASSRDADRQLTARIKEVRETLAELQAEQVESRAAGKQLAAEVKALQNEDLGEIQTKIDNAEETNRLVRAAKERKQTQAEVDELDADYNGLTSQIEKLDESKAETIRSAKYPIEGLTVTDDGIELDDLPWDQASSAEQLRCSVAMGLALNPELKVLLVRDGSLLDEDSLRMLGEMADEADGQVWIERVSEGDECSVIITDGEVAS